ncbi:MAG: right-handed parallel beta-helix repeat-containing protein [Chitinispirillaceae bacterium]|nr:right-handed parallel beta-helix repeat-containing protein [Chitinispirillaceae bacterium]
MIKLCQVLFFSAILFIKCSNENNGNPIVPPLEVLTKDGTISNEEAWSETDKIYRITDDCSIESQVTWGEGIKVIIDPGTVLSVGNNGILTIEKGVTMKLCDNSYIEVGIYSQGTLKANGSADSPVVFKADTGVQAWGSSQGGGIILGDSAKNILLNYCIVTEATAGINVKAGSPVITNCKVTSCKGNGIYFESTAGPDDSLTFTNNTISDCSGYPLTLPADKLGNLSGKITFSGFNKENNGIHILGVLVKNEAAVWRKMDLPYIFSQMTVIGSFSAGASSVTIMPGVVCKFEKNAGIRIGDPSFGVGILIAKGTPEDSIYFINSSPDVIWGDNSAGIWIGPESTENTLFEYCSIRNATTGICAAGTLINVSNCRVTGCDSNGITFNYASPVDSMSFNDNFFVKNAGYGISISADQLSNLSGTGSVADNGKGGIYVSGETIWQSGTWKKYDMPFIVDGTLDISGLKGVEINIHPGTEFHFLPGSYIDVGKSNPGTLIARGSDNLPIIFDSYDQDEYWGADEDGITGGIRIGKNADVKTELKYCKVNNATSGVYVDANVKIENCSFTDNQNYGIVIDKNADQSLIKDNSFSENGTGSTFILP